MKRNERTRRHTILVMFLGVLSISLAPLFMPAGAEADNALRPQKTKSFDINDFTYSSQRRDPFERAIAFKTKNPLGMEESKTGYELEELRLVGVMKAGPERFAVMEDMQGKGLLFKKGQSLNGNLWVSEILEEKIILGHRLKGDTRLITLNIPRK